MKSITDFRGFSLQRLTGVFQAERCEYLYESRMREIRMFGLTGGGLETEIEPADEKPHQHPPC
jgi:hypothetical protein